MKSTSKENNKTNIESDNELFILNSIKNLSNNENIYSNNKLKKNQEEQKHPFTNLVIKERMNTTKSQNIINKEKSKYRYILKKIYNDEEFLNINKLYNINMRNENNLRKSIKNLKNKTTNEKPISDNKNEIKKNLKNKNKDKKDKNRLISATIPIINKKISKGQQTLFNSESNKINSDIQNKEQYKENILNMPLNILLIKNNDLNKQDINIIKDTKNLNSLSTIIINKNKRNIKNIKINILNDEAKEEKKEEKLDETTDYINYIKFPKFIQKYENKVIKNKNNNSLNKMDTSNTISLSELYAAPKYKQNFIKTNHLIRNSSNIVNFNDLKFDNKKETISIRELYRKMALLEENNIKRKKRESAFKRIQLKEYKDKNGYIIDNMHKKNNKNLMDLENYIRNQKEKKIFNKKLKLKRNKSNIIKGLKNKFGIKNIKCYEDDDGNIFNNILKSFSRVSEKNEMKIKNNKNFRINIQTMMELFNKDNNKNNISKKIF